MKGAIVGLISVALFFSTVSCLLTNDFSTPGTLKPSDLVGLIDWELTGGASEGQNEEGSTATIQYINIDGNEVVYVQGFRAVWFDLTKYVKDFPPGANVQVSVVVKSTEHVTMYFHINVDEGGKVSPLYSTNDEVEDSWKTVSIRFLMPESFSTESRLLLKIEISEDAVFYIRNLSVLPGLPTGGSGGST